jgi:hypothetical protein
MYCDEAMENVKHSGLLRGGFSKGSTFDEPVTGHAQGMLNNFFAVARYFPTIAYWRLDLWQNPA